MGCDHAVDRGAVPPVGGQWTAGLGLAGSVGLAVSGTPAAVGARLRQRNAFADRTTLMLYNETEPDAVKDLISSASG